MSTDCLTPTPVVPGDPTCDADRQDCNKRFDVYPRAIVYCRERQDVARAVRCATGQGIPLSVRSGGHCYEGFSLCDGFVVDVSKLNEIRVGSGFVDAGPGVRLLDFYNALAKTSVVTPGGTCASVGLAGLSLNGGFGLVSRKFGLTSDNLLEVELVTADGTIVTANKSSNEELYWACRGGGGSFGIATRLRFATHPIGGVTQFVLTWSPWQRDLGRQIVATWQDIAPRFPDELTCIFRVQAAQISCQGVFIGSCGSLEEALAPLLSIGEPTLDAKETTWIAAATFFSDETMDPYWKASSAYAVQPMPSAGIALLVDEMLTSPPGSWIQLDNYGGAVNRVPTGATAFPHRAMLFSAQYIAQWNDPKEEPAQTAWLEAFAAAMRDSGYLSRSAYANYCDLDIPDYLEAYYGPNLRKLRDVKTRWDPSDVFRFGQSTPPWR